MSRHWKPDRRAIPIRRLRGLEEFRRAIVPRGEPWDRRRAKGSGLTGTTIAVVLGAAACAGIAVGLGMRESPAAASAPQGEHMSFGSCEWGGGRNCVVDGDTIHLHGAKIRIAGIDAPETHDLYKCDAELALGRKAAARLKDLLNSGAVSTSAVGRDEDVYGRKLRNVAVDGRDVGEVLVSEGLAREYGSGRRGWC